MSNSAYDVAVVGAGPAGSAVAAALAQRGWSTLLLEQDALPRHKVCGEFLSPEAQGILQRLGLRDAVDALEPVALHDAEINAPGGRCVQTALPGPAMGVSRFAMDAALASAAQASGATLWTGVTALDFVEQDEEYHVRLRTRASGPDAQRPASVRARLLILAAGRHNRLTSSSTRTSAAGEHGAPSQQYVGVKCHYENVELPDQVALHFFDGGYGGINPVEGGNANFCLLVTYEAFQERGKSPAAMLDAVREQHPVLDRQLAQARLLPETLKTVAAVDTSRPATPWLDAPCVGDAAAMITPLCGDGMAMALRAAELCAPPADAYLRGRVSRVELADAYSRAWHSEFDRRLRVGRLLQTALTRPVLAGALMGVGRALPPLVSYLVHTTRGTTHDRAA